MGNAGCSLDNLMYFRSWTAAEVREVQETLRRRKATLSVDRKTYDELIGITNQESVRIFDMLDSDSDGLVDTFEVLLTLTLWCCASWEEKLDLLFCCYDFNRKGVLRFPELALLVTTAARVLSRFADLPPWAADQGSLRDAALAAFGGGRSGELAPGSFSRWFRSSDIAQQLRDFVDASMSQVAPDAVEAAVRERVRLLEYRVKELSDDVQHWRETTESIRGNHWPNGTDEQNQQAEALWERVDGLFARLAAAEGSQRSELKDLADGLSAMVAEGRVEELLEPPSRSKHGRLISEIDALERRGRKYLEQVRVSLGELLELSGALDGFSPEGLLPALPADSDNPETVSRRLQILDREMRLQRGLQLVDEPCGPESRQRQREAAAAAERKKFRDQRRRLARDRERGREAAGTRAASRANSVTSRAASRTVSRAPSGAGTNRASSASSKAPMPVVVAFAAFSPPHSEDTLMLALQPGDEVMALGQDGQGWWYGRQMSTGQEGWFPPSYVQVKDASLSRAETGQLSKAGSAKS